MSYCYDRMIAHMNYMLCKETHLGWEEIRLSTQFHTIYWIYRGEGVFSGKEEQAPAKAGCFLYAKPGQVISLRADGKHPMCFFKVKFECAVYDYDGQAWGIKAINTIQIPFCTPMDGDDQKELNEYFQLLFKHYTTIHEVGETPSMSVLLQIIHLVHRICARKEKGNALSPVVRKIKQYIDSHYCEPLEIKDLAIIHSISPSYLRKLFLQQMRFTPKQYLDQVRNAHAIRLVKYSDLPFKAIAETCGYANEFHFSRRFKEMNRQPPSMYRRQ